MFHFSYFIFTFQLACVYCLLSFSLLYGFVYKFSSYNTFSDLIYDKNFIFFCTSIRISHILLSILLWNLKLYLITVDYAAAAKKGIVTPPTPPTVSTLAAINEKDSKKISPSQKDEDKSTKNNNKILNQSTAYSKDKESYNMVCTYEYIYI